MSARDDSVYLAHILEAIGWIESYLDGVDEATFRAIKLVQDGVVRELEIMGEAVKRLSPELRRQHASVPWSHVAKMRDKLIHGYFGVDLDVVWQTARVDLPALKEEVLRMRTADPESSGA